MTQNEFNNAALAVLRRKHELPGAELQTAIREHLHPVKMRESSFYIYMHALCLDGVVTKEMRPAPTLEQHVRRGGNRVAYYRIASQSPEG